MLGLSDPLNVTCTPCKPGLYSSNVSSTVCDACTPGMHASQLVRLDRPRRHAEFSFARAFGGLVSFVWPSRRWLAGFVQSRSGSTDCMNCDYVGDSYQEDMNGTACIPCPKNTQRYLRLLSGANKTACQCQKGASDSSPPVAFLRIFGPMPPTARSPFSVCLCRRNLWSPTSTRCCRMRPPRVAPFAISVTATFCFARRLLQPYWPGGRGAPQLRLRCIC